MYVYLPTYITTSYTYGRYLARHHHYLPHHALPRAPEIKVNKKKPLHSKYYVCMWVYVWVAKV